MGCDIHAFVEVRGIWGQHSVQEWHEFAVLHWLPRHYHFFAIIAGVRDDEENPAKLFEPRGWPDRCSIEEDSEEEQALLGEVQHDRSWLLPGELKLALEKLDRDEGGQRGDSYWRSVLALMLEAEKRYGAGNVRLVFGFDN